MSANPSRVVLRTPDGAVDLGVPERSLATIAAPAGTLLVDPAVSPDGLLARDPAGGWRAHPSLFWSLIRPMMPSGPGDEDPVRAAWQGLAAWRGRDLAEVEACRALAERHTRGAGEMIELLRRVAAPGPPPGHEPSPPPSPVPSPARMPTDTEELTAFMTDPGGFGAAYGETFTPRREQAELAVGILRAFLDDQALVAEAGTGTGKTLAYLVPLLARLQDDERRAVVSTYSRALQHQILAGDLPRLLGPEHVVKARLLMGRSNYLCLRQRTAYLTRPLDDGGDALRTLALRCWLAVTEDGLREELARHPLLAVDCPSLFSSVQPCTPACHVDDRCFVARARRLARQAQLVVVNHALLVHDAAAGGALIGPYEHLVVDEAQRLPSAALDARSVGLHRGRLRELEALLGERRAAGEMPEVAAMLVQRLAHAEAPEAVAAARTFGAAAGRALRRFSGWWRSAGSRLEQAFDLRPGQRRRIADKDVAFAPLRDETRELLAGLAEAATAAANLVQRTELLDDLPDEVTDLLVRAAQAGAEWGQLERDVRFVTSDPSDRWVTWVDPTPGGAVGVLGATPLESGPLLREVWQERGVAPVATSATLAVAGDFGFMLSELGLTGRQPRTATLAVPSPFRWDEQSLCLAPERMPDPDTPEFLDAVATVLDDLRREAPRQTLVLFTAYRALQEVAARLADRPEAPGAGPILVQSPQGGVDGLRERFRTGQRSMLLGTSTFWEGVDFPGASLEIVVVTKLPFLVPGDPWVEARCEHLQRAGENAFTAFMLRDAVLRLRQGVGRLLRRDDDRGVILLLDNRLITRQYGATFRDALPAAVRWLDDHHALAAAARRFLDEPRS
ncbi:DEAD/DEAH box helicase [bacterium]|nr:DEAD/DEAH box helicase [bacterium]